MKDWQQEALERRDKTIDAIATAHVDAGKHDHGWIRVDSYGNLERVDPNRIKITYKVE